MPIKVRLACASDVNALVNLEDDLFNTDQISKASFYYHIRSQRNLLLISQDQDVHVGYILMLIRSKSARIYSLAVAKNYQGKGIGSLLLKKALCLIPSNIDVVKLEVNVANSSAIRLYQKFNFVITDNLPHFYFNGDSAYRMKIK